MTARDLNKKRESLKSIKDPWEFQFGILGKYIYTRKQAFQQQTQNGAFLNDGMINDSTAVRANMAMSSAILGALWKAGGKTFRIRRPDHISDTRENNDYYLEVNKRLTTAMESPKAHFEPSFHEMLCEEGAFGTACIALFQGDFENPLIFKSWSIQSIYISEGQDGFVDTVYYDESITIDNLVARYGIDSVSEKVRKKYEDPKTKNDRVKICIGIEPRPVEKRAKDDSVLGMPIASYHFMIDDNKLLKESGFTEMPARVLRWYKLANEVYGRGPGMDALPAIMQINALKESFLVGVEKKVDPPIYVMDDGSLGGGSIDTSARGLSVFNSAGRPPGQVPIGQIFDVGELQSVVVTIQDTKEEISQHFLIDRLYDLNNKTRMTLGEAEIRTQIRGDALSSVYARHTMEGIDPLINRSFNIMFSMGLLGVNAEDEGTKKVLIAEGIDPLIIPEEVSRAIVMGKTIYVTDYISPAAQTMQETEYRGLMATMNNAMILAPVVPEVTDVINVDEVIRCSRELTGAPIKMIKSEKEIKETRALRAEAIQKEFEARIAETQSKALKNVAGAKEAVVGAAD